MSVARTPVPFSVETHVVNSHNLVWSECSTRMVYLQLKAAEDKFASSHNVKDLMH